MRHKVRAKMCIRDSYEHIAFRGVEDKLRCFYHNARRKAVKETENCLYSPDPVSYTHLDVYKRQELSYEQIAKLEGCTKMAVKGSVDIALKKLKKLFEKF